MPTSSQGWYAYKRAVELGLDPATQKLEKRRRARKTRRQLQPKMSVSIIALIRSEWHQLDEVKAAHEYANVLSHRLFNITRSAALPIDIDAAKLLQDLLSLADCELTIIDTIRRLRSWMFNQWSECVASHRPPRSSAVYHSRVYLTHNQWAMPFVTAFLSKAPRSVLDIAFTLVLSTVLVLVRRTVGELIVRVRWGQCGRHVVRLIAAHPFTLVYKPDSGVISDCYKFYGPNIRLRFILKVWLSVPRLMGLLTRLHRSLL